MLTPEELTRASDRLTDIYSQLEKRNHRGNGGQRLRHSATLMASTIWRGLTRTLDYFKTTSQGL